MTKPNDARDPLQWEGRKVREFTPARHSVIVVNPLTADIERAIEAKLPSLPSVEAALRYELRALLRRYAAHLTATPTGGVMAVLPGPPEDPEAETYVHLTATGSETFPREDEEAPKLGRGGWPPVPSAAFPGELALTCQCGSQNITMGATYALRGTASGGRGRLGDPGSCEYNKCETCGYKTSWRAN